MTHNPEQEDLQYLQDYHGIHPHEVQEIRSALNRRWGAPELPPMSYTMPDYIQGRSLGIPHHELLESANSSDSGLTLSIYTRARALGVEHDQAIKFPNWNGAYGYLNAREAGATHDELEQVQHKGMNLFTYAYRRGQGHSHEEIMSQPEENPNSGGGSKYLRRSKENLNSEYNQYYYKKSLSHGATHDEIVEAHQAGVDLSDYDYARHPQHRYNPNFSLSHNEIINLHKSGMMKGYNSTLGYVEGRAVGIPHHELVEAHQTIEGAGIDPEEDSPSFNHDGPLKEYVNGRELGLNHKESLDLLGQGINPAAYVEARYNASHKDILDAIGHGMHVPQYNYLREYATHKQALEVNSSGMDNYSYGYPRHKGATHEEVMDAYRAKVDLTAYGQHRGHGLSHEEAIAKYIEEDTGTPIRPNPSTASRQDKFNSRTASESNGPRYISYPTYKRLKDEHRHLTTQGRIEVAKLIETARGLGDLSENGDYQAAKQQQGEMESRINQLEHLLTTSVPMKRMHVPGRVNVGDKVHLQYEGSSAPEQFILVDPEDATTLGSNAENFISPNSPAGVALLGKQSGETVEWHGGSGLPVSATIKHVEPVDHGSEFEDFDSHEGPTVTKRVAPSLDVKDIPEQAPDYKPYNWQEHFAQE